MTDGHRDDFCLSDPETRLKIALWRCRRGMLELECLLIPFARNHFTRLSEAQQQTFQKLLKLHDHELYALLSGNKQTDEEGIQEMVDAIIQGD